MLHWVTNSTLCATWSSTTAKLVSADSLENNVLSHVANCTLVGIIQLWNWGWTYINLQFNNCGTGIDISAPSSDGSLNVGSAIVIDSSFTNTPVAVKTGYTASSSPDTAGSLILENVKLNNVPTAVQGGSGSLLAGGSITIAGWGQGHRYVSGTSRELSGDVTAKCPPQHP